MQSVNADGQQDCNDGCQSWAHQRYDVWLHRGAKERSEATPAALPPRRRDAVVISLLRRTNKTGKRAGLRWAVSHDVRCDVVVARQHLPLTLSHQQCAHPRRQSNLRVNVADASPAGNNAHAPASQPAQHTCTHNGSQPQRAAPHRRRTFELLLSCCNALCYKYTRSLQPPQPLSYYDVEPSAVCCSPWRESTSFPFGLVGTQAGWVARG